MLRIRDYERVAIAQLLHRHQVSEAPVPIFSILRDEGWTIDYVSGIEPLWGWAMETEHGPWIHINADMTQTMQRAVLAHEAFHILADDEPAPLEHWEPLLNGWTHRRTELRAWVGAAYLMIPEGTPRGDIQHIARTAGVPDWLAALRFPSSSNTLYALSVCSVGLWSPIERHRRRTG